MKTTLKILIAIGALLAAWEAYTLGNKENGDTISATIKKVAAGQPFIVFASGLLCGHLFWPLVDKEDAPTVNIENIEVNPTNTNAEAKETP